ncbi:DUF1232 domain-containing protein [candidate division KSB1 bacterium]|nr:DUF1232 domain-containing protein [candidate division KSB1 bacterium]
MNSVQMDFYQKIRRSIRTWANTNGKNHRWSELLLTAPDLFHLLVRLSLDSRVPVKQRGKLLAAIAYFISPLDFIPEGLLGPIGFTDDIALAAYVLNALINQVDIDILREHWAGEEDVLQLIGRVLASADQLVGKGLWEKLRRWISNTNRRGEA